MAIFTDGGLTPLVLAQQVQARLVALRDAFAKIEQLYEWSSGVSASDLEAINFSTTGAPMLLTAVADARAEAVFHNTGLPPSTYPQPPTGYVYSASQALVITTATAAMFANRGMI